MHGVLSSTEQERIGCSRSMKCDEIEPKKYWKMATKAKTRTSDESGNGPGKQQQINASARTKTKTKTVRIVQERVRSGSRKAIQQSPVRREIAGSEIPVPLPREFVGP